MSSSVNSPPDFPRDVVITPEPAYIRVTPIGFHVRAREFLDAAKLLAADSGRFSFAAAFLACRSIELGLKAYLIARGDSPEDVRSIGHDLQKSLTDCYARGIDVVVSLTSAERDLILRVNSDYMGHNFAYFDLYTTVFARVDPELHLLPIVAEKILEGIRQGCLDASDGRWSPLT